jgi:hypothetical protein
MKQPLYIAIGLLAAALLLTAWFFYPQFSAYYAPPTDEHENVSDVPPPPPTPTPIPAPTPTHSTPTDPTAEEGLLLSDLPLLEWQRTALSAVGVDPETIVVTQATIECAKTQLGAERYEAMLAGETPTFFETAALLRCL